MWRRLWLPAVCHVCCLSCFWVDSTTARKHTQTHMQTGTQADTQAPTSASTCDQEREREQERETCFHLQDKCFLLYNLLMLIFGEYPSQSTHARTRIHAHLHARINSHVNICGDRSRRQSSRTEPHLLLDLPHTHTAHTHTRKNTVILHLAQTKPGLVFHRHTHKQQTHI